MPRISLFLKHLHCGKRKKEEKTNTNNKQLGPGIKKKATAEIVGR